MERGVDPAFVIQSLEPLQKEITAFKEKRADLQNANRVLDLPDDGVANICCAVGDYLEDLGKRIPVVLGTNGTYCKA